jgi:hypothetical protein
VPSKTKNQNSGSWTTFRELAGRKSSPVTNETVKRLGRDESLSRAVEIASKYAKQA